MNYVHCVGALRCVGWFKFGILVRDILLLRLRFSLAYKVIVVVLVGTAGC